MKTLFKICLAALLLPGFCFRAKAQCSPALFVTLSFGYDCLTSTAYIPYTALHGTAPYTYTFVNVSNSNTVATGVLTSNSGTITGLPQALYTVYFRDVNGCQYTASYQISISYSSANLTFMTGSVSCYGGANGSATVTPPSSFSGSISYSWSPNVSSGSTANTLSANIVYSVTATDGKGCKVTNTLSVIEPPAIESVLNNTFVSCFGGTLTSGITSTNNVGATSYTVDGIALPSNSASNLAAGIHTIITKDSKNCVQTNTALVDQQTQPLISFSVVKPTCPGIPDGQANPGISNTSPAYSYTWLPSGINTPSLQNALSGTYTLVLLDGNGCTTRSVVVIQPAASASVSVLTHPENCSAADGAFTLMVSGVSPPFSYTTLPVGPHPNNILSGLSSGNYTAITNYNGSCLDSLRFTIGNLSTVNLSIVNSKPVLCNGVCSASVLLNAQNAVAPVTYSATGLPATTSNQILNMCAGFYELKVVDAHGCPATATVNFVQPPAISYTATAPSQACTSQAVSLQASASGGTGTYTYIWNPGGFNGQVVSTVPPGTTVYSLNAYDSNSCTQAPAQVTVVVLPAISVTVSNTTGGTGICPGSTAQITPTVAGGDGTYKYLWLPGSSNAPSVFVTNITVPVYTLVVTDGCGSPAVVKYVPINLFPVIKPAYLVSSKRGCEPFCATFINLTPKSKKPVWNYGDKPVEQAGDTTRYCYEKTGLYNLTLSVVDSNNCRTLYTFNDAIEVLPSPTADFISDPQRITLKNADQVQLKNTTDGGVSYKWFVRGKAFSEMENATYAFPDTGCYKVTLVAEGANRCVDTANKYLCVEEDFNFYMPNCFTPNDNDLNEVLMPKGTGWQAKNYLFEVYTRWGTRLFKTNDIHKGWDGTNSDESSPMNLYIWRVLITDTQESQHSFQGQVLILR